MWFVIGFAVHFANLDLGVFLVFICTCQHVAGFLFFHLFSLVCLGFSFLACERGFAAFTGISLVAMLYFSGSS